MALTSDQITAQNFKDFYGQIRPYLNGTAHGGFTPIGTVISLMGKQAPHNYLVCDGTVYNIADYPELAAYFAGQFNLSNFFGGDGVTTFAVPDLRGEFLRGTGTNSHTNTALGVVEGSGADVGVHQESTSIPSVYGSDAGATILARKKNSSVGIVAKNADAVLKSTVYAKVSSTNDTGASNAQAGLTIRPTNTSVLYCIATKNIFMDAGCNYNTDEIVVGTWVDGKPVYQKVLTPNIACPNNSSVSITTGISNIDTLIKFEGLCKYDDGATTYWRNLPKIQDNNASSNVTFQISGAGTGISIFGRSGDSSKFIVKVIIVQYTKTTD
jgi:microcystin-dependent protein